MSRLAAAFRTRPLQIRSKIRGSWTHLVILFHQISRKFLGNTKKVPPNPQLRSTVVLEMGTFCSKSTEDDEVEELGGGGILGVADDSKDRAPAREFRREDFIRKHLENETVVRAPGEIAGQQFIVDDCKKCSFFLFDNSDSITIDDCVDCTFFIGPCESSVFIRNCSGCSVVVACRQFRLRDCKDLKIMIYCAAGQPIIETSSEIGFCAFDYSYFSLAKQLQAAGMHPWDTEWSNVHDFNKPTDGEGPNWNFLPETTKAVDLMGKDAHEVCPDIKMGEEKLECPVPATWGRRPRPQGSEKWDDVFVLVSAGDEGTLVELRNWAQDEEKLIFVRSRTQTLAKGKVAELRTLCGRGKNGAVRPGLCVGVELSGPGASEQAAKRFAAKCAVSSSSAAAKKAGAAYFDTLAQA